MNIDTENTKINNITLQYLLNPLLYDKLTHKSNTNSIEFINDQEFYKKRIINLTKQMLKNKFENEDLKNLFEMYIKNLIIYFKEIDTKDILQKTYNNLELKDISKNIIISQDGVELANSLLYRESNKPNLNNYVKYIKTDNPLIIPLKKDINLKNPSLKKKGLKKTKEKENI